MAFIQENCGLFGIYGDRECAHEIYAGIDFLQHRGQEYCGIATHAAGIHLVTHYGTVGTTFNDYDLNFLKGRYGIGHVSLRERQPVAYQSRLGEISLAFSGNVLNADEIIDEMKSQAKSFHQGYHIEVIAKIIMAEKDVVTGIRHVAERVRGAYSLLVLTAAGIYAVRDVYGFRPLTLGSGGSRNAVSSESRALQNLDMEVLRDVLPGEIVLMNGQGFHAVARIPSPRRAHCAFEWAYTASVDSVMEGVFVQEARNRLGQALAERDLREGCLEADLVAPVPMSGIGHAIGYHQRSGVTYQEVFLYNRYADRSYTLSTQFARERMAKRKLSVLTYAVRDKRVVLVDDSIVRGTQISDKVRELKKAGAREVHVRVACPPLMYPCDYGISTRSYEELAARRFIPAGDITTMGELRDLEAWIARELEATSVKYNSQEAFVDALGLPRNDLCLKCWDGRLPHECR